MRKNLTFILAALAIGCAASQQFVPPTATPTCVGNPAGAGLEVYVMAGRGVERFDIGASGTPVNLEGYDVFERIPRNNPGVFRDVRERFPQERGTLPDGERLAYPAASSPDGSRWAAAVQGDARTGPTVLAIRDGAKYLRLSSLPGFSFSTLVWSPASDRLAVLQRSNDMSPKSILDVLSPHPVQYSDIVLTIHSPRADVICQTVIVKGRRAAQNAIEWVKK